MELTRLSLILAVVLYLVYMHVQLMRAFRDIENTASRTEQITARMLTMVGQLEEQEQ
jgi:hypothetical protein